MPVDTAPLGSLLKAGESHACAALARVLLAQPDLSPIEKAVCHSFLSRSLHKLRDYRASIEAGVIACHLAEEVKDWDLLAETLLDLSEAQFYSNFPEEAVASLRRFFQHRNHSDAARKLEGYALVDMGVYLRTLRQYAEALTYLDKAWIWWRRQDPSKAELCRSYIVWINLTLGNITAAERLLPLGDEYVRLHPEDDAAITQHLHDRARYLFLKGDLPAAAARAWECLGHCEKHPDAAARTLLILADVMQRLNDQEAGVVLATLAKVAAEKADRHDLIAEARQFLMNRLVQDPDGVEKAMSAVTGSPALRKEKGGSSV